MPAEAATQSLAGHRVALACTSRRPGPDGVAYVGRLLERTLSDLTGAPPRAVDLDPAAAGRVSLAERLRFTARVLAPQLRREVDWVFYNHLGIARTQRTVPAALGRPYAVFIHGVEVWGGELSAERRAVLAGARVVVANSNLTARRAADRLPRLPVAPCPLAFMAQRTDAAPVDGALLHRVGERSALIVGRMSASERYKGHDELLDCWRAVRERAPGAQLVIAGSGDDAERLAGKASQLGLADDVLFCGRVSDATLEALFARCAVFTLPSRGEGFGIVYLQAMAAGLPCVAGRDDAGSEVVLDGETGVTVDPRDGRALADAVGGLLANAPRARALGAAGRRRVATEYAYDRFRDRLGAVLGVAFNGGGTR